MALPSASGPALQVWEIGEEILVELYDNKIQRTINQMTMWKEPEQPYPMRINNVVECGGNAIISWIDEELRLSLMAEMNLITPNETEVEWQTNVSRTELKQPSGIMPHIQKMNEYYGLLGDIRDHTLPIWIHTLDAEVLSMASHENNFAFVSMNRGIYYMQINKESEWAEASFVKEIWRQNIPDWPKPWPNVIWKSQDKINGNLNTFTQSIHLDHYHLILFDERGSWVMLSADNGEELSRGQLAFKGKNTGTWKGENGWAILEDNKKLHLFDKQLKLISTHKTPGPVNHARESKMGWIWTGWRHNGSEKGIKSTKEIGLWVDNNENPRVFSNDGNWYEFSY